MNISNTNDDNANSEYRRKKVLLVDDFPAMSNIMASILEELGFKTIHKATDGYEASLMLKKTTYDLIISDWNMPKMTGIELLRLVRKDKEISQIPFIMVTANISQEDVVVAIKAGVSEYLVKPFSLNVLKNRVSKAFTHRLVRQIDEDNEDSITPEADKEEIVKTRNSILLVDDEPNNLLILTELLREDYKIQSCRSGQKAIDICNKENKPDLILLDIMMPEMDGLTVCKELQSNPLTDHIPIIFVSALSQTDDVVKGLTLGAVDYVIKPITPGIILARVKNHMKLVNQRKSMSSQVDVLMDNMRLRDDIDRMFQHDLRNPLAAIMTAIPLLEQKSSEGKNEVKIIKESSEIINQMVENQMTIYKCESSENKVKLEPINAYKMIQRILYSLRSQCEEKKIFMQFNISQKDFYLGDELLSFNMFSNC